MRYIIATYLLLLILIKSKSFKSMIIYIWTRGFDLILSFFKKKKKSLRN